MKDLGGSGRTSSYTDRSGDAPVSVIFWRKRSRGSDAKFLLTVLHHEKTPARALHNRDHPHSDRSHFRRSRGTRRRILEYVQGEHEEYKLGLKPCGHRFYGLRNHKTKRQER